MINIRNNKFQKLFENFISERKYCFSGVESEIIFYFKLKKKLFYLRVCDTLP